MPNYCENELLVQGKNESLKRFIERSKGENGCLDIQSFIPYPEEFSKQDKIAAEYNKKIKAAIKVMSDEERREYLYVNPFMSGGFHSGGSDWCRANWGTNRNFCDPELVSENDDSLEYCFETAWSPPEPVIKKMAEIFPELRFELRYFEGGMCFNGILILENGEVIEEDCANYYGHRGG